MKKKFLQLLRWLPLPPLGFLVFIFAFVIPGCRFEALVCLGTMGIITF